MSYMQRVNQGNPITSLERLVVRFEEWLNNNPNETIGGNEVGVAPHLYVRIGGAVHRVHADTKKTAVEKFVANHRKGNEFKLIPKRNQTLKEKGTNDYNEKPIKGFYMYLD